MIKITKEDFSLEEEFKKIHSQKNGAYSFFLGTVRQDVNDNIDGIFLECYEDLAYNQLNKIKEDSVEELSKSIEQIENQMYVYAKEMEFEKAAQCRDKMKYLKRKLIDL